MNCRPGDLAILVRSAAGNEGAMYRVLHWIGPYQFLNGDALTDVWRCECLSHTVGVMGTRYAPGDLTNVGDSCLQPLRDPGDDAKDEMLRPLPHKEIA